MTSAGSTCPEPIEPVTIDRSLESDTSLPADLKVKKILAGLSQSICKPYHQKHWDTYMVEHAGDTGASILLISSSHGSGLKQIFRYMHGL